MQRGLLIATCILASACGARDGTTGGNTTPPPQSVMLEPPRDGHGFQLGTGEFVVEPGTDYQGCHFMQVPGTPGEAVFVNRIQVAQNDGSHHMNIFRVRTIVDLGPEGGLLQTSINGEGPCFDSGNWADWPLVINSQTGGVLEWELPEGVAHRFEPGEWLMLQTHYVNATTQQTPGAGKVLVNFHTVDAARVQHEVGTLFATKQNIRICQSDDGPVFEGGCQFNSSQPIRIIGANGHFHSRGRQFDMYIWDGLSAGTPPMSQHFYRSESWDDPPMLRSPELDRVVPSGGGIWYSCGFEWVPPPADFSCNRLDAKDQQQLGTPDSALDCCYTFGGPVDWAEHCNVFAYYYPKIDDVNCF